MWNKIKVQCTPDEYDLDQLLEQIVDLKCDHGPIQFIETCKKQQERLHISEEGVRMKPMAAFIRFCVQRFPRGNGWEDFKLRFKAEPAKSWGELTIRVQEQLQATGQSMLQITEDHGTRRNQHQHHRALLHLVTQLHIQSCDNPSM